jgi:hypothetical protein
MVHGRRARRHSEPTMLPAIYICMYLRRYLLNRSWRHLVQITLPDRGTFHTVKADGSIYSLSATERRCSAIVCWNRSDTAVANLVLAGTQPRRISPERLHLALHTTANAGDALPSFHSHHSKYNGMNWLSIICPSLIYIVLAVIISGYYSSNIEETVHLIIYYYVIFV